jgi:hypothetical protein
VLGWKPSSQLILNPISSDNILQKRGKEKKEKEIR